MSEAITIVINQAEKRLGPLLEAHVLKPQATADERLIHDLLCVLLETERRLVSCIEHVNEMERNFKDYPAA